MAYHSVPNPNRRQQPIAGNLAARNFTDIFERRLGLSASNLLLRHRQSDLRIVDKQTRPNPRCDSLNLRSHTSPQARHYARHCQAPGMARALCLGLQPRLTPRPHRLRLATYVLRPNTPLVAIDPGHLHSYGGSL
jgi:hypothetical protein